jgi:hypothetical protein
MTVDDEPPPITHTGPPVTIAAFAALLLAAAVVLLALFSADDWLPHLVSYLIAALGVTGAVVYYHLRDARRMRDGYVGSSLVQSSVIAIALLAIGAAALGSWNLATVASRHWHFFSSGMATPTALSTTGGVAVPATTASASAAPTAPGGGAAGGAGQRTPGSPKGTSTLPVPGAGGSGAASSSSATTLPPALDRLATCIRSNRNLQALFLVDVSASLQQTDPGALRVAALQAALRGIEEISSTPTAGGPVDVRVAVSAFATSYERVVPFEKLPGNSDPASTQVIDALSAAVGGFATHDNELDTDFETALDGARADLGQAMTTVPLQLQPCQLLVLLTDGAYSFTSRDLPAPLYAPGVNLGSDAGVQQAITAGRQALCQPLQGGQPGTMQQLRDAGVVTVAVGLTPQIGPTDQDFLRAVAEGQGSGYSCAPGGSEGSPGIYLAAPRPSDLVMDFHLIVAQTRGGGQTSTSHPTCDATGRCTVTFEVPPATREFDLLADPGAAGASVTLVAPAGQRQSVTASTATSLPTLSGAALTAAWPSSSFLDLTATQQGSPQDWKGTWSLVYTPASGGTLDPRAIDTQIFLIGDLSPALAAGEHTLIEGQTTTLRAHVVGSDGQQVDPASESAAVVLTAQITDPRHPDTPVPVPVTSSDGSGGYELTAQLPTSLVSSQVDLRLTLVATGASAALPPRPTTVRLDVVHPAGDFQLRPQSLDIVVERKPGRADLTVTAPTSVGGCVWFAAEPFRAVPREAGTLTYATSPAGRSPTDCLRLAPGQSRTVRVWVGATGLANGRASGDLDVSWRDDHGHEETEPVSVTVVLERPVDGPTRWILFTVGALLFLLPVILLYLANWRQARIARTDGLRVAAIPVLVGPGGGLSRGGPGAPPSGAPLDLELTDFGEVNDTGRAVREFPRPPLIFRARMSPWPVLPPYVTVAVADAVAMGIDGDRTTRSGKVTNYLAKVPRELAGSWVLAAPRPAGDAALHPGGDRTATAAEPVTATLYYFVRHPHYNLERLRNRLLETTPRRAEELHKMISVWLPAEADAAEREARHAREAGGAVVARDGRGPGSVGASAGARRGSDSDADLGRAPGAGRRAGVDPGFVGTSPVPDRGPGSGPRPTRGPGGGSPAGPAPDGTGHRGSTLGPDVPPSAGPTRRGPGSAPGSSTFGTDSGRRGPGA